MLAWIGLVSSMVILVAKKIADVSKAAGTPQRQSRGLTAVTGGQPFRALSFSAQEETAMQNDQDPTPHRHEWRLFPAVFVIGIGLLFLLRNLGIGIPFLDTQNWWAWIMLIAAIAPLARAIELYRQDGRISGAVVHHLVVAAAIALVAVFFILNLSWNLWWPLLMILAGIAMLGGGADCRTGSRQTPP
jgi:hypothetical protein